MISKFLKIFIIILSFIFSGIAKAEFSEDFSSVSNISSQQGIYISTTTQQASLVRFENTLLDSDTLLISHLGTTIDVTNSAIGVGGTTASTTFSAGYDGDAITLTTSSLATLSFPRAGNINARKGAISIWAKSNDWEQSYNIFSQSEYDVGSAYFSAFHTPGRLWFYVDIDPGWYYSAFLNTSGDWATSTWHNLIFSWDCDVGLISITHDGANYPFYYASSNPGFSLDNSLVFGAWGSDISFDELRITSKPYNPSYNYTQHDSDNDVGVYLESAAFDTGVASPVWGNIEWASSTPDKTALYIQTNVSADNSAWDGWLNKGMVALTFDDGYVSNYTNARPILGQYGLPGTAYVIAGALGMTLEQMHTLESEGWEIGCHGYSHGDIYALNEAQIRSEFGDNCATYLRDQGFDVKSMATPFGRTIYGANKNILSDYFTYIRGYGGNANIGSWPRYGPLNVWWNYFTDTSIIDTVGANKEFAIFTFHVIDPNDVVLTPLAAYIYGASSTVDAVTYSEGMSRLSYQTPAGSQINVANKRYIKYRAFLFSENGSSTPILSSVTIREPAHIYKETTTTVNVSGVHTHSVWPQTTDTELDFTLTTSASSIDVAIDSWSTTSADNNYYKKWRESATTTNIIAVHNIGGFQADKYYRIKIDSVALATIQASATGSIAFTYTGGYSDHVFEAEEMPLAPTPTGLNFMRHPSSLDIYVDSFPNDTVGSSGYLFWRTDNSAYNSGWIQTNQWHGANTADGQAYTYGVKYRNANAVETATTTLGGVSFLPEYGGGGIPTVTNNQELITNNQTATSTASTTQNVTTTQQTTTSTILNLAGLTGQARQVAIQQIRDTITQIQKQLIILIGQLIKTLQEEFKSLTIF